MVELFFSTHALQRMKLRLIDEEIVNLVVNRGDGFINQSLDKKIFYRRFVDRDDNLIAVVLIPIKEGALILTVMNNFEVAR